VELIKTGKNMAETTWKWWKDRAT